MKRPGGYLQECGGFGLVHAMGLYHAAVGGDKGCRGVWRELSGVRVGGGVTSRHGAVMGWRGYLLGVLKSSDISCANSFARFAEWDYSVCRFCLALL